MKQYPTNHALQANSFLKNKVFWISIFVLILIATTFWTQSRVPALNQKAQIGDRINISAIAFDVVFPVIESQPLYERVYKAAINWGYTNWKGMTFGFLLASAFITLLQMLPKTPASKHRFLNSLFGLGMGSPLGVCVNCATPIAQGMIHAGARLETSLAMLISSPTLNPIVLTIAFSLLSFHVVLIKILLSVFFIIFIVPLLVKLANLSKTEREDTAEIDQQTNRHHPLGSNTRYNVEFPSQTWFSALYFTASSLLKNLFYIIKITLPLMLVAGLLGSLLIEILPSGSLSTLAMEPQTLLLIAAIGVFLPVPIAFDVLIVNILISSGLNIGLASTLLFSLGIFSIYPALIIGRSVSIKLSLLFFVAVMIVAVAAGLITHAIDQDISRATKILIEKELGHQGARLSLKDAIKTCRPFRQSHSEQHCLNKILLSDLFAGADTDVCTLEPPDDEYLLLNKPALDMCHQVFSFVNTKKEAIVQKNIDVCNTLSPDMLIDECRINYIRSQALEYSSLDACLQISNPARQRYCRAVVMGDRMPLKTEETCELGLSHDLKRQCLDNLNAHITSESGDLEKCNALASNNAGSICRSTVVSLKIANLHDYAICKSLKYHEEVSACKDQVIMHRSVLEKDPFLCETLINKRMTNDCRINAAIRKKQVEIETLNFLVYDNSIEVPVPSDSRLVLAGTMPTTTARPIAWAEIYNDGNISLAQTKHLDRSIHTGKTFKRLPGTQLGLSSTVEFDLTDFMEPFIYGKGVASGDFNNDGWPDLAFASNNGLLLYANKGDGSFGPVRRIAISGQPLNAFIVTFIDIDNDGWQDLFVSAYASENYFFKNTAGHFSTEDFFPLPKNDNIVTLAAGFSDWDRDGDLDVALGNWSYGAEGAFIPEKSQNIHYRNDKLQFTPYLPDEPLGETLSLLLSDINSDGYSDLIIGNDRKYPDIFYLGKPGGEFSRVTNDMDLIQATSMNTMSYDSADFNNDLLLDIFSTDMFVAAGVNREYCDSLPVPSDKKRCKWLLQGNKAVESLDVGWCASIQNKDRAACYTAMAIRLAKRDKNELLCNKVSPAFPAKADFCRNIAHKIHNIEVTSHSNDLAQHESNKLLINTPENGFIDATESMGVKNSYWGWTGKAADLDNDGWQDIYIGNGLGFGQHGKDIHSNIFYHNRKGLDFIQAEEGFGLTNYTNTPSYTYLDFDLDGDIDIVTSGVMSTPSVFVNQGTTGNSLSFVLRDNSGNKFCIGCKIIIHYDDGKKSQIRELKLSGGFMSYDDPVAYFGINEHEHIDGIKVIWSTGETSVLNKALPANRRYRITRHDQAGTESSL